MTVRPSASINPSADYVDVVIASGQTESEDIDTCGLAVIGIETPTLTSTTLTFKVLSRDGVTYVPVSNDAGSLYDVTINRVGYSALDPSIMVGIRQFKVVGDSAEGADRTLRLVMRL